MRVRNVHRARVAGLTPGAEGDVDPKNLAIEGFLRAGLLVPVEATPARKAQDPDARARVEEAISAREAILARDARIAALEAQVAALEERLTSPTPAPPTPSAALPPQDPEKAGRKARVG